MNEERVLVVRSWAAATYVSRTHEPLRARMSGGSVVTFEFPHDAVSALTEYTRLNARLNALADEARAAQTVIIKETTVDQPRRTS